MAKCLRCGADSSWLQGEVPKELVCGEHEELVSERDRYKAALEYIALRMPTNTVPKEFMAKLRAMMNETKAPRTSCSDDFHDDLCDCGQLDPPDRI